MFQFAGLSPHCLCVRQRVLRSSSGVGFPIRKSSGQRLLATSPRLIAGYCVLHRLFKSRHPPYALICLNPKLILPNKNVRDKYAPDRELRPLTGQAILDIILFTAGTLSNIADPNIKNVRVNVDAHPRKFGGYEFSCQ